MNKDIKIAFLTPFFKQNRGNSTTAKRIVSGLRMLGIDVIVFAYEEETFTAEKINQLRECNLFHILHISRFLKWMWRHDFNLNKPFILTNGGTDVNHDLFEEKDKASYQQLIEKAAAITVFTGDAVKKIRRIFLHPNIWAIPQSVWFPDEEIDVQIQLDRGYPNILLPAGLRKVKDLFFVIEEINQLRIIYKNLKLIIAGIVIETAVYDELIKYKQNYPWIIFIENVPLEGMKSLYKWADVVLNTSISEGQASTILEAMEMSCFVAARRNPGNESIITDHENGLLYSSRNEFLEKMLDILEDKSRKRVMLDNAKSYVHQHHSHEKEILSYISLYNQVLK